ncbi:MAG TPA: penicillin acylase family protein, partial [Pyrinomonadaceae bacterium]|nr:penicillin acylase family protein [Pyrinomonadaceae bacterium]
MSSKFAAAVAAILVLSVYMFAQATEITTEVRSKVTVRRDARSIPYIEAGNDADLYFAQGFVTASDRLWQMDFMRRVARGELAEIFGRAVLEEDKHWRRYGFAKIADDSLPLLDPGLRKALDAYTKGVNAYISMLTTEKMPLEFKILQYRPREWTPSDTVVIGKILADALSSTWRQDLIRASFVNLPKDKIADLTNQQMPQDVVLFGNDLKSKESSLLQRSPSPADADFLARTLEVARRDDELRRTSLERTGLFAEELAASNNWVISGKRTIDGKALLAND